MQGASVVTCGVDLESWVTWNDRSAVKEYISRTETEIDCLFSPGPWSRQAIRKRKRKRDLDRLTISTVYKVVVEIPLESPNANEGSFDASVDILI